MCGRQWSERRFKSSRFFDNPHTTIPRESAARSTTHKKKHKVHRDTLNQNSLQKQQTDHIERTANPQVCEKQVDLFPNNTLKKHSFVDKVITHSRSGVNKAINRGINETSSEIVVITGTDGLFGKDTIPNMVCTLLSSDGIWMGSVVIKDIPDNVLAYGNPARVVCGVDEIECEAGYFERGV